MNYFSFKNLQDMDFFSKINRIHDCLDWRAVWISHWLCSHKSQWKWDELLHRILPIVIWR